MKGTMWLRLGRGLLLVGFVFGLTGCVDPTRIVTPSNADLQSYRRVYLMQPKPDPESVTPRVAARLKQMGFQVADVIKPDSPSRYLQGTAFLITSAGHLLTCAHVVEGQTNATSWIGGKRYVCQVLAADTNLDLALLQVQGEHEPFTPLILNTETNYSLGQDVYSMGFPLANILGSSPRLNNGMISATVGLNDDPNYVQFSAPVQPGNSGGPLLNAKGEVIGVAAKTLSASALLESSGTVPQNVNFAIKMDSVFKFLGQQKVDPVTDTTGQYGGGFDAAQKSLGLVRAGIVTDEELKQPTLLCIFSYVYVYDLYNHFRAIEFRFCDYKSGDVILKAGQYIDDLSPENGELDRIFRGIAGKFFPGQPDLLTSNKKPQ